MQLSWQRGATTDTSATPDPKNNRSEPCQPTNFPRCSNTKAPTRTAFSFDTEPALGTQLVTLRSGYEHHGIYVGNGRVIHYAGFAKSLHRGPVEEISFEQFAAGHDVSIRLNPTAKFVGLEAVRRAAKPSRRRQLSAADQQLRTLLHVVPVRCESQPASGSLLRQPARRDVTPSRDFSGRSSKPSAAGSSPALKLPEPQSHRSDRGEHHAHGPKSHSTGPSTNGSLRPRRCRPASCASAAESPARAMSASRRCGRRGMLAIIFFRHDDGSWNVFPPQAKRPSMGIERLAA